MPFLGVPREAATWSSTTKDWRARLVESMGDWVEATLTDCAALVVSFDMKIPVLVMATTSP